MASVILRAFPNEYATNTQRIRNETRTNPEPGTDQAPTICPAQSLLHRREFHAKPRKRTKEECKELCYNTCFEDWSQIVDGLPALFAKHFAPSAFKLRHHTSRRSHSQEKIASLSVNDKSYSDFRTGTYYYHLNLPETIWIALA